jgi:hypothetical protein
MLSGELAKSALKAPDTSRRAPTEPKPFNLSVDRRAESRSRSRGRASVADGHGAGLLGGGAAGRAGPQTRQRTAALMGSRSILDAGVGGALPSSSVGAGAAARPVSAGRQRPVSAGRSRPSLTIPQSPLLRTKARHHSVSPGAGSRRARPPERACAHLVWGQGGSTGGPGPGHASTSPRFAIHRPTPQPPPPREEPKTEFRARPAPTFDSFGAK